ncbi:hypothetical protein KBB96_13635 [Luteolibacter ambystomatis]|uniref:DUF4382 domain-containing protein n=1 Tax=Luteolibacter ambystomatis TaxID=2824561 RepID=A0A975IY13_9BACT|nr:hypothetical protein [Luteolibacter ambystomatis]QUE49906.1 hypothetical protein KBB96_13635 [Luteolibacter ambystomatis]
MRILKAIGGVVMAVVFGGSLVSCSGVLSPRGPESPAALQKRGLKPGEGYLVATFDKISLDREGGSGPDHAVSWVQVERAGKPGGNFARLKPAVSHPIYDLLIPNGRPSEVVAMPLPAGNYELTGWRVETNTGGGWIEISNRLPIRVPLQVNPGEATYVGRFRSIAVWGRNFIGVPVLADGAMLLGDDFSKDQSRISNHYPMIRPSMIHRSNAPATYQAEMRRVARTPREEAFWKKWL